MSKCNILICFTVLFAVGGAAAAQGRYVHLRNDARLVQQETASAVTLRCEAMGAGINRGRWLRDCNDLAREVLTRMARKQRLAERDVPRKPLAGSQDDETLETTRALAPAVAGG